MDYTKINSKLKDLNNLRNANKPVHREVVFEINRDYDGDQGSSDEIYEVYDIGLDNGLFVKLEIGSDSYGREQFVVGVQFVQAQEKTIKVYEYKK